MTHQEDIDLFIKEYKEAQEVSINRAKHLLIELVHQFWDKNPEVNLITWPQYTPYFNDGDTCTFDVPEITFSNTKDYKDIRYGDYIGGELNIWTEPDWNIKSNEINKESAELVTNFIRTLQELNLLDKVFGDDSLVIITRDDGIIVEDYSDRHD